MFCGAKKKLKPLTLELKRNELRRGVQTICQTTFSRPIKVTAVSFTRETFIYDVYTCRNMVLNNNAGCDYISLFSFPCFILYT